MKDEANEVLAKHGMIARFTTRSDGVARIKMTMRETGRSSWTRCSSRLSAVFQDGPTIRERVRLAVPTVSLGGDFPEGHMAFGIASPVGSATVRSARGWLVGRDARDTCRDAVQRAHARRHAM